MGKGASMQQAKSLDTLNRGIGLKCNWHSKRANTVTNQRYQANDNSSLSTELE